MQFYDYANMIRFNLVLLEREIFAVRYLLDLTLAFL